MIFEPGQLLDKKQLAAYLGISDRTVRRWKQKDVLPAPLISHTLNRDYWTLDQIKKWQSDGLTRTGYPIKRDNAN